MNIQGLDGFHDQGLDGFHTYWMSRPLMFSYLLNIQSFDGFHDCCSDSCIPLIATCYHFVTTLLACIVHCTKKGFLRFRATPKTKSSAPPSSLFSVAWEVLPPKLRCGYFEATNVNSRPPQLLHQKPTFPHFWVWHSILMGHRERRSTQFWHLFCHTEILKGSHSPLRPMSILIWYLLWFLPPPLLLPSIFAIKSISWLGHCGTVVCYKSPM